MKKKLVFIVLFVAILFILLGILIFLKFKKNKAENIDYEKEKEGKVISLPKNVISGKCNDKYCVDFIKFDYVNDKKNYYNISSSVYNNSNEDLSEMNIKITLISKNKNISIYKCLKDMTSNYHYMFEEVVFSNKNYKFTNYEINVMNDDEIKSNCM